MSRIEVPRRVLRVIGARWLFAAVILLVGLAARLAAGPAAGGAVWVGLSVVAYNAVIGRLWRLWGEAGAVRLSWAQMLLDSLAAVVAVRYGSALTPAVLFLFLFPLFVATLLSPREGLFLTAGLCGGGYALAELAAYRHWLPIPPAASDPTLQLLAAVGVVIGALLAAATVNNYLVRTLAGIEADLTESESKYRRLANSLEDEVRQRTADLRRANEELNTRHRELLRLREVDAAIHASDSLETVLQRVVDGVAEIVPASQAAIFLREPEAGCLRLVRFSTSAERRVAAVESLLGRPLRELRIPLREGTLAEYAVRTREPIITSDFERVLTAQVPPRHQHLVPDVARVLAFQSSIAVPLAAGDELIGLLALGSRDPLGAHDLERVRAFATQAGMALVRVRHERDLEEQQAALEQAYRELQRSQEQVVHLEKMRAIGEMTSGVAHNFNNALTAILGTTQVVLQCDLPQPVAHRLRIIEQSAQDASLLVQRIRAFTKSEPPKTTATDINDLVSDAVAMTEPRWRHHADRIEHPITVETELRASVLAEVEPAAIREVLINLILNAVNALPDGGRVLCRSWDEDGQVVVTVKDNGIGMSEETRQRCFEPFFTTGGERGTGLGLSVAYGIIQRHKGDIRVVSSPGLGAEFIITLPTSDQVAGAKRAVQAVADDPGQREIPALHAMVVDDQPNVRQTLGDMLSALGLTVTMIDDGREAVQRFDPAEHDLVITDWGMPGMSGLAVARAIKSRSPNTPVVLITGFDAKLPSEVSAAEEVDYRIQKPLNLGDLTRTLQAVASLSAGS